MRRRQRCAVPGDQGAAQRTRWRRYRGIENGGGPERRTGRRRISLKPDEAEGYRVAFRPYSNPAEEHADALDEPQEESGISVMDTGQVDREIARLEKERSDLDRELVQAGHGEDGQAIQELKRRIAAADQELAAQDSDAYRKSHATHTEGA